MAYDINEIVSPAAIKQLTTLEQETAKVVTNILKIHDASAKLDSTLAKMDSSKIKGLEAATKKATTNNEKLGKSTVKLNHLQSSYIKTLVALQRQKEKEAQAQQKKVEQDKKAQQSTINLTKLESNYMKTLSAMAKQKERATKKTADQIKYEKDLAIVNSKTAGTLEKLAAKNRLLIREQKKLNLEDEKGKKRLQELNKQLDANNKKITESSDAFAKQKRGIGGYQDAIESSIPALRGMGGGIKAVGMQLKLLLANPIILFLAAIVGAFMALKKALTRTEAGQDRYNKIMEVMGAIMSTLMDIVTKLAIVLVDAFTKPKKAIKDLWEAIKSNIVVRFKSLFKLFGALGKVIKAALHFDVDGIKKNAKIAAGAFIDMNTGIEDTVGKTKKFLDGEKKAISAAIVAAKKKADFEAEYNRQYRNDIKENAKLNIVVAKDFAKSYLLQRTNGEKSIELLNKGFDVKKKIAENEYKLQQIKVNMLHEQAKEAKNDIAMNNKVAEAEAALENKRAAIAQVDMQRQRRLGMIRMQAFSQEMQRNKAELAIKQILFKQEQQINQQVLDDTRVSLNEKIQLLSKSWHQEEDLIRKAASLEIQNLSEKFKLKLISQKDYGIQVRKIVTKENTDLKNSALAHKNKTATITKQSVKEQEDIIISGLKETDQKKVAELKKQYLAGEISKQEYENKSNEIVYQGAQKELNIRLAALKAEIDAIPDNNAEKIALQQQYNDLSNQLDDDRTQHAIDNAEKRKEKAAAILQQVAQLESGLFNFQKALSERKIAKLKEEEAAEIKSAGNNAKEKKKIEEKYQKEIAKIKRRQAIMDKADALFKIAINTAVAIMKAAPNPFLIAFVATLGALQAATVIAKPIPKYASGTDNHPGGLAVVGDSTTGGAAREIIEQDGAVSVVEKPTLTYLKAGAKVFNNRETERIFATAGKDDTFIRDAIDNQTKSIVKAIKDKKEIYFDKTTGTITERDGNYFKQYINNKITW